MSRGWAWDHRARAGSCGPSHIDSYGPAGAKAAGTLSLPEWMGECTGKKECREVKSDQGHTAQTRREHKNGSPNSGSDTGLSPGPKLHPLKELLPQPLGQGSLTPRKKKKKVVAREAAAARLQWVMGGTTATNTQSSLDI